ncbi:TonB-dependent receptor [Sphingomonas sp. HITSZ_GF]|uniref:TonB-dependent receptor n=1 Tax=Sphingomonas sp. HITSZ_GF TaxID=3037247 RepID=UPI00240D4701|nr:TonB-dependent receptor [Sphingomonas sp. HITSZ_GF]MDG2533874.1 TonB-dependent receptor [Sphingomonas sp. HITSZ_GF]
MKTLGVRALLVSVSLFGLIQGAHAQDTATTTETTAAAPEAQDAQEPSKDGQIIVTAQRREQALQDVPLAISVISSEGLEKSNFTTIADVQFLSPGVNYNANFGGGFNVRGVGTQSLLMSAEQSVALVIDDVIQGLPEVSFAGPSYQSLVDIERIEVLKGPQGTLFGKNSSAGVIQIITANPKLGRRTLDGSLSYASKNEINAQAVVNLPIGDTAALRVAAGLQRRDGFVHDLYSGEDHWGYERYSARAKFLWKPSTDLSVLLEGEYRYLTDNANGMWTFRNCGSGFGTFKPCTVNAAYGLVPGPNNLNVATDGKNSTEQKSYSLSGRIDYDLGGATITSITAYRDLYQPISLDTDATPRPVYSRNENVSGGTQFSQELRVNGEASIFNYTLGAFYYDARPFQRGLNGGTQNALPDSSSTLLTFNAIGPYANQGYGSWVKAKIKSWAIFGQVEAEVLPGLSLIAGGRYTNDDVRQVVDYFDVPWLCRAAYASGASCHGLALPLTSGWAQVKASKFTYKLTAKYDIARDINIYATYATGYKGPMISHPANQPQLLLRPELSKSYEIGLKTQLFDRVVTFNIDAFLVDYSDFQGQQRVGVAPIFYYTTTNAGGLRTKGIEADMSWRIAPNFSIAGNIAYIPTKFTEFSVQCYDLYANPATTPGQCNYVQPGLPAGTPAQFNAAGYPLTYSPKWTWGVTADYSTPLSEDLNFDAHASYNYRSSSYGVVADPNSINPGYGLLNAQLSIGGADKAWTLAVFARNLLNEHFVGGIFRTPLDSGTNNSTPLSTIGYSNIPALDTNRTVGVKLSFSFGN